jgi:hypothetical protein
LPAGGELSEEQRAPILTDIDRVRVHLDAKLRNSLRDASLYVERLAFEEMGVVRAQISRISGGGRVGEVVVKGDDLRVLRASDPLLARLVDE